MIQIINWVFKENIQILKETFALATDEYNRAFEAIVHAKRIGFYAIGDAMIPCQFAYFKFRRLGYDCIAETDCDLQVISACNLGEGDVAIAVSHTGNTRQVNNAMEIAHKKGATTIGITKRERSEMIKHCDIKLFTATPDMSVGQEAVARRVAEQAILEALYFGVLQSLKPESHNKIQESSDAMKFNKG
jgi:DNA-binding MurR/RpiR family transcriptional regulator